MTTVVVIVLVVAVAIAIAIAVSRYRQSRDGVDSFRRQIDALSPEARRPVVDQVQSAADANDETVEEDGDDDEG